MALELPLRVKITGPDLDEILFVIKTLEVNFKVIPTSKNLTTDDGGWMKYLALEPREEALHG